MKKSFWQSKTVWTGIAAIVGSAGAYSTGQAEAADAIKVGVDGLIAIFLRQGIGFGN